MDYCKIWHSVDGLDDKFYVDKSIFGDFHPKRPKNHKICKFCCPQAIARFCEIYGCLCTYMQNSILSKCLKFGRFQYINKGYTGKEPDGAKTPKFSEPLAPKLLVRSE